MAEDTGIWFYAALQHYSFIPR